MRFTSLSANSQKKEGEIQTTLENFELKFYFTCQLKYNRINLKYLKTRRLQGNSSKIKESL